MKRGNSFVTEDLEVRWSHLHKPDSKFGLDSANHNITVILDDETMQYMDDVAKEMGCTKINSLRTEDDGMTTLKSKTKLFVRKEVHAFPCVDAAAKPTTATPYGGDRVKLRLTPVVIERDNSLSMFLNGVQIIEKSDRDFTGGFDATDGFDGSEYKASAETTVNTDAGDTEDLPF